MKKLTKNDVADLVLVFVAMRFVLDLLRWVVNFSYSIGLEWATVSSRDFIIQIVLLIAYVAVVCVLLFRRSFLIRRIFSDGAETELEVSDGLLVLTNYAFWIRLLGIMTFLSSAIALLRELTMELTTAGPLDFSSYGWLRTGMDLISVIAALSIIRYADWIAEKLEKLGSSTNGNQRGDDLHEE